MPFEEIPKEMINWAIVQAAEDIGIDYTFEEFNEWRKSTPDPSVVPSARTVGRYYGTWDSMKELLPEDSDEFYGPDLLLHLKRR